MNTSPDVVWLPDTQEYNIYNTTFSTNYSCTWLFEFITFDQILTVLKWLAKSIELDSPQEEGPVRLICHCSNPELSSSCVFSVATVFLGVYLPRVRLDMKAVYLMIAYCAGVVVIVAFELALLVSKTSRTSPSPPSMGTTGGTVRYDAQTSRQMSSSQPYKCF